MLAVLCCAGVCWAGVKCISLLYYCILTLLVLVFELDVRCLFTLLEHTSRQGGVATLLLSLGFATVVGDVWTVAFKSEVRG